MKRWIVYLLAFVGLYVCHIYMLREVNKKHWNWLENREISSYDFSPNWNHPRTDDIFIVKDTLGVIRYYKIVKGLQEGTLALKTGRYQFSAGLKEPISLEKWNFEFMNQPNLYVDSIQQFSLEEFLTLKENIHLTRGFGMAPISRSKNDFHLRFMYHMIIFRSLAAFFIIWLFGFINSYLSTFTRFSEEKLLGVFFILLIILDWNAFPIFGNYPLMKIFHFWKGFIYAFGLFFKFLALFLGGVSISWIGAYIQFLITSFFGVDLFSESFTISTDWRFHISPFIGPVWLAIATGNFLNNFRKHFFQLRRKAKAFKYAQKQELEFKSELETLQAKINPHFLYNSLNSIASLAQSDPAKTETMALALSKFYKEKTNRKERIMSTVEEEMEMIRTYLAIEKIRFGDRLEVELSSSEDVGSEKIPRFLLQPLIENAIKYGYDLNDNKIIVKIFVKRSKDTLIIQILDSGPAFSDELDTGFGIRSIQKKLRLFYPDSHQLEFINHPEKQVFIQLKI